MIMPHRDYLWPRSTSAHLIVFLICYTWSLVAWAQSVSGQARAVKAILPGSVVILADSGSLSHENDARTADLSVGDIASLGKARELHATAISSIYSWNLEDFVASEASLVDLELRVAGNLISADFIMAKVTTPVDGSIVATSVIDGLIINGWPITVTEDLTQQVPLNRGQVIINDLQSSPDGAAVTALRIIIDGVAVIAFGSATARILPYTWSTTPTLDALDAFAASTASTVDATTSSTTSALDSTTPSSTYTWGSTIPVK